MEVLIKVGLLSYTYNVGKTKRTSLSIACDIVFYVII